MIEMHYSAAVSFLCSPNSTNNAPKKSHSLQLDPVGGLFVVHCLIYNMHHFAFVVNMINLLILSTRTLKL